MNRSASSYGIFGVAVLLVLAASTFVSIEVFQRRRFEALRQEIEAALKDFQGRAASPGSRLLDVHPGSLPENGQVKLLWHVYAMDYSKIAAERPSLQTNSVCTIWLSHRRTVLLRFPEVAVLWPMDHDRALEQILDAILKARGVTYNRGIVIE